MSNDERVLPMELGGMAEAARPTPGTAELIEDMRHDPEGWWEQMPGIQALPTEGGWTAPVLSMFWFNPRPGQSWLVFEDDNGLDDLRLRYLPLDGTSPAIITITDRKRIASRDPGSIFLENQRWLYIFSAADAPLRWDGQKTAPVGFDGPPGPPRVAAVDQSFLQTDIAARDFAVVSYKFQTKQRGVGPFPDSQDTYFRYGYSLTYINDLGQESPMSPIVWGAGVNASTNIGRRMVRIGIDRAPTNVRAIRLWRTANLFSATTVAGVTSYLLAEFTSSGPIDYVDHTPDEELLPTIFDPDSVGPVPRGARAAAFWSSRLWLGGIEGDPTRLYYSRELFAEQFPEVNRLTIGSAKTGPIVALFPIPRGLIVFKTGGVYLVKLRAGEPKVEMLSETVGTQAPRAVVVVRNLGVAFLDRSGPHLLVGTLDDEGPTKVVPLHGLRRTWKRLVGRENLDSASAHYDPEFGEVWWQVPRGGENRASLGIVYHPEMGQWTLRPGWYITDFSSFNGRTWVCGGYKTGWEGIWHLTRATNNKGPDGDIVGLYRTSPLDTDDRMVVKDLRVGVVAYGDQKFKVETKTDREESWRRQTNPNRPQKHTHHSRARWGDATWSATELWSSYDLSTIPVDLWRQSGHSNQVQISSERIRLVDARLVVSGTPDVDLPRRK